MDCVDLSESRLEERGTYIGRESTHERGFGCGSKQGRSQAPVPGPSGCHCAGPCNPIGQPGCKVTPRAQRAAASVLLTCPVTQLRGALLVPGQSPPHLLSVPNEAPQPGAGPPWAPPTQGSAGPGRRSRRCYRMSECSGGSQVWSPKVRPELFGKSGAQSVPGEQAATQRQESVRVLGREKWPLLLPLGGRATPSGLHQTTSEVCLFSSCLLGSRELCVSFFSLENTGSQSLTTPT